MQNVPILTYTKPITCTYLPPVLIAGPSTTRVLPIMRILDTYKYCILLHWLHKYTKLQQHSVYIYKWGKRGVVPISLSSHFPKRCHHHKSTDRQCWTELATFYWTQWRGLIHTRKDVLGIIASEHGTNEKCCTNFSMYHGTQTPTVATYTQTMCTKLQ